MRSFVGRHPVASYLVAAYAIFWAWWMPVLFLGAPPLAALAIPLGALLFAVPFLGSAPLQGLVQHWPLLFTAYLPQLLLALVSVQFLEELGWSGYLRVPISGPSIIRDLSVLVIVLPFAVAFRVLIAFAYNRTAHALVIAAITHTSFNESSELIAPNVSGGWGQILAFASTGLLALLALLISKGSLAYHRHSHHPSEVFVNV